VVTCNNGLYIKLKKILYPDKMYKMASTNDEKNMTTNESVVNFTSSTVTHGFQDEVNDFTHKFILHSKVLNIILEDDGDLLYSPYLLKDITDIPLDVFEEKSFNSTAQLIHTINTCFKYDTDIYQQLLTHLIDKYIVNLIDIHVISKKLLYPIMEQVKSILGDGLYRYIFAGDFSSLMLKDIVLSVSLLSSCSKHITFTTPELYEAIAEVLTNTNLLPVLEYCKNKYNKEEELSLDFVAKYGNLGMMKYAHEKGCPWHVETTKWAANNGHLECLNYAHENGCPWNASTTVAAAKNGHLECLKYTHENGCPWDSNTTDRAVINGRLECLKYSHENGCPLNVYTTMYAAINGHLECLKYARENGCRWDESTTRWSAKNGHLECLKYAHENGCPWNESVIMWSAENGHLDCLKYAHENGCHWDGHTSSCAASNGHLECLKYIHENGCYWHVGTTRWASKNGHLECLKYAIDNGCPS
jgi:hypothetical protein